MDAKLAVFRLCHVKLSNEFVHVLCKQAGDILSWNDVGKSLKSMDFQTTKVSAKLTLMQKNMFMVIDWQFMLEG